MIFLLLRLLFNGEMWGGERKNYITKNYKFIAVAV